MRKSEYTKEMGDEICDATENSHLGLRALCKKNKHWPVASTIRRWINDIPSFQAQYARAKEAQIENLADEIIEISDDDSRDSFELEDGTVGINHAALQRDKLRTENRKWIASKLLPKKYGDTKQGEDKPGDDFISRNRDKI